MPADPETPMTIKDILLGLFGLGGAGAGGAALRTIGRYEQRVDGLESAVEDLRAKDADHDSRFSSIETTLSALDERSQNAETSRNRIETKVDRLLDRLLEK